MLFFIDIGNTRIKYCVNQEVLTLNAVDYQQLPALLAILRQQASRLLVTAGRSKRACRALSDINAFAKQSGISTATVEVKPQLLKINYHDSKQFGADRFLHLLAGRQHFQQHFCVISCGTAITLDFYTQQHIGGMIAPGLGMAKDLLSKKAGLHKIEKPTSILGNDSATSIGSGIYFGYKNLIYGSIREVEKKLNLSFQLIFTGGDAELLSNGNIVINELLFKGMRIYDYH
ncbi:MAG: hypothetical protein CR975_03170 [Gammaproteobacteria bacterium]|nr:MAG: hypothetical protein CR975_03170 [Gammaproteobacteria bacterium]